jgi:hypothetical protein
MGRVESPRARIELCRTEPIASFRSPKAVLQLPKLAEEQAMAFTRLTRRCWTLAMLLVLALPSSSPGQRLPTTALPTHYSLHFAPDLEAERFTGRAIIDVVVPRPTDRIVLHAVDLAIHDAVVVVAGHPQRAESRLEPDRDTLTLRLPQPIGPGDAQLRVTYTGVLTRELRGFYLSEANGRKYAMTQLEATDARRMFPSFDEPALKATFQISSSILIPRLMRFNVTVDF